MSLPSSSTVASPCVRVCRLNVNQTCIGCGRTVQEIANWSRSDVDAQLAITARADERLQSLRTADPLVPCDVTFTI